MMEKAGIYLPLMMSEYNDITGKTQAAGMFSGLVGFAVFIIVLIGTWKVYQKAGQPGWAAIIPIYNLYILFKISWGKGLYILLLLIPLVNVVILYLTVYKLALSFGKGIGYSLGLILLPMVFFPMLGFGDATYLGVPS